MIDIAEEMLEMARARFKEYSNISIEVCDYTEKLPDGKFDAVISGLSIHHIDDDEKQRLFSNIYGVMPQEGIFVNYDQFCAGDPEIDAAYEKYWMDSIYTSGIKKKEIEKAIERRKLDKECSVYEEIKMLKKAGFSPECI